jgi:hypothetical protein
MLNGRLTFLDVQSSINNVCSMYLLLLCTISRYLLLHLLLLLPLLLPPIPTDGQYSGAFVSEFKIFVAELRDFFNAAGLTQLLEAVKGAMSSEDQQVR